MNAVVSADSSSMGFLAPKTMQEAIEFAGMIGESDFVPKEYAHKPGNILVAMQLGSEVGLGPIQSLQTIAVINNRPTVYGDGLLALVQSSPLCENFEEGFDDETQTAWCRVRRTGRKERVSYFSMDDATQAKLLGKQGPWSMYPKRMCQMRARSWALRDEFADVLKGLSRMRLADEMVVKDITPEPESHPVQLVRKPAQETVNTVTGEIIEEDQAAVSEEMLAAIEMIREGIDAASTANEMKTLKREILELPQGCQVDLVNQWNERKKALEAAT